MSAYSPTSLIYIHGFNSSPRSTKAELLSRYIREQHYPISFQAPQLPSTPSAAISCLARVIEAEAEGRVALVGSSLGGYYAAYFAERYGLRAVLINPAIGAYHLLSKYIGENHNPYSGEVYTLGDQHMIELRALETQRHRQPSNLLLMVQTGDETLDFRLATRQYHRSPCIIEYGGDHRFRGFVRWLPFICHFLRIAR